MGKSGKLKEKKKDKIPELRAKTPSLENYIYVATLAQQGKRSIPKQIELIIEEHKKLKAQQ